VNNLPNQFNFQRLVDLSENSPCDLPDSGFKIIRHP